LNRAVNYDSVGNVTREGHQIISPRERAMRAIALGTLVVMFALGVAGPSGLLAWGENLRLLDQRRAEVARLDHERSELRLQVNALDPRHADPDLVGELLRKNLNVVHSDEVVITLDPPTR
jgi:cell division protein FtsB